MSSNSWWAEYRKQKYKIRKYLTTEMILRKSFVETGKEYIEECSLSVLRKIFDKQRSILYRLFWLAASVTAVFSIYYYLKYTWVSTFTKPMVTSIESFTYPISEIDFPAFAFCNVNRISKKAVKKRALEVYPSVTHLNITLQDLEIYFFDLGRLTNFKHDGIYTSLKVIEELTRGFDNKLGIEIMKELSPDCNEMLVNCMWAAQKVNCSSIFHMRRTILGFCCAFNYVLDYDSADRPSNTLEPVKRQIVPGPGNGLSVIIDPLLDDYSYTTVNRIGFQVIMYDPIHYPDLSGGRVSRRLLEPNEIELLQLRSVKQLTTEEVRKYPVTTRQCYYQDENYDTFHGMYSYSACLARCRIFTVYSLCRCLPFFMPSASRGRVCTLSDLQCLSKYQEKLRNYYPLNTPNKEGLELETEDSLFCPECLPDCEFTQHFTKSSKLPLNSKIAKVMFRTPLTNAINFTNTCTIHIFQNNNSGTLRRMDVVAYWFEILSNIGGFAGMVMGVGIFTAIEILYYLFIRFTRSVYLNYTKYHY